MEVRTAVFFIQQGNGIVELVVLDGNVKKNISIISGEDFKGSPIIP